MADSMEQALRDHTAHDKDSFERLDKRLDKFELMLATVAERQSRQVGFFAGIAAAVTAFIGAIALLLQWLRH